MEAGSNIIDAVNLSRQVGRATAGFRAGLVEGGMEAGDANLLSIEMNRAIIQAIAIEGSKVLQPLFDSFIADQLSS